MIPERAGKPSQGRYLRGRVGEALKGGERERQKERDKERAA